METELLALVEQDGFRSLRKAMSRGGQLNGPCPFCGGTDRFRIQPNYGTYGWFACSQCGKKGNAIDYLMLKRGLSKREALAQVGWKPRDGSTPQFLIPRYAHTDHPQWSEPPERWQEAATEWYQMCQRVLWSKRGVSALDYLRKRGLSDAIIRDAYLGYHPSESYGPAKTWGKAVRLPQGIVIPWFFQGEMWRVTVRDEQVQEGPGRYKQVSGGSNGLYLADSLHKLHKQTVVVVEGELDALSVLQECRGLVAVVATGTTQGSHTPQWVARLAQFERVLIAFDAEDKGDTAATWWMQRLANTKRLRPWWKDANQMLQDGADLRVWVTTGLEDAQACVSSNQAEFEIEEEIIPLTCATCGVDINDADDFSYTAEGIGYCHLHYPRETTTPVRSYEAFLHVVEGLASVIPNCTIHRVPKGYTLEQHVKELQAHRHTQERAAMLANRKRLNSRAS